MSIVKVQGNASGTGIFTVASPNSNTDRTLTLPDATGTVQVSGQPVSATTGTFSGTISGGSTIGVGGATPAASGAGITFPASQSASTDANTLDDYEEGTWTPVITDGTTSKSGSGTYTKIGNTVRIRGFINNAEEPNAFTGTVYMTGLPFTSADRTPVASFINYQTGTSSWSAMTAEATTQVRFYQMSANGADNVQITGADTNTYTDIYVGGVYSV